MVNRVKNVSIDPEPVASILYKNPKFFSKNEHGQIVAGQTGIPVHIGSACLPRGLDALIVTSDLQGTIEVGGELHLMGLHIPDRLIELITRREMKIAADRTGVILCGDLYAHKKKRGGYGDVTGVWRSFNKNFAWVAGVLGNHDLLGSNENKRVFLNEEGIHLLETSAINMAGLTIAGTGLVIGNTNKPNRLSAEDYLEKLAAALTYNPHLLVLHAAPYLDEEARGESSITDLLKAYPKELTVFCGHEKWINIQRQVKESVNVINVDERVLILLNDP